LLHQQKIASVPNPIVAKMAKISRKIHSIDDRDPVQLLSFLHSLAFNKTERHLVADPTDSLTAVKPSDRFYIQEISHP
jgi:hypothetical protein